MIEYVGPIEKQTLDNTYFRQGSNASSITTQVQPNAPGIEADLILTAPRRST